MLRFFNNALRQSYLFAKEVNDFGVIIENLDYFQLCSTLSEQKIFSAQQTQYKKNVLINKFKLTLFIFVFNNS